MRLRATFVALAAILFAGALAATTVKIFQIQGASAFLSGSFEGVRLDDEGALTLGAERERIGRLSEPFAYSAVALPDGWAVGTGNDGKVYQVASNGTVSELLDAPEPDIFALWADADGTLFAGSSPDGKVYRIRNGKAEAFFDPRATYIWAIARGSDGVLWVATGVEGKLFRVEYGGIGTMSKSKNNGVDPQALVDRYGADTARLFMMFAAPPEQTLEWSDEGVEGAFRFMKRLWRAVHQHLSTGPAPALDPAELTQAQKDLRRLAHQTLAKVTDDIGRRRTFNTAIAAVMELLNALAKADDATPAGRAVAQEALELIVLMLSPIVPHATHALWHELGHAHALIDEPWPKPDPAALAQDTVLIVVQVNGRLRGRVAVPAGADEATARAAALADEGVQRFVAEQPVRKLIYVPGKLVNVVV